MFRLSAVRALLPCRRGTHRLSAGSAPDQSAAAALRRPAGSDGDGSL